MASVCSHESCVQTSCTLLRSCCREVRQALHVILLVNGARLGVDLGLEARRLDLLCDLLVLLQRGAVGCVLRQFHAARVCGGGGGEGEGEGDGDTGNGARSEGACVWRPG